MENNKFTYANHYIENTLVLPIEKYVENLQKKGKNLQRSEKYAAAVLKNLQKFAFKFTTIWDDDEDVTFRIRNGSMDSNWLEVALYKREDWIEDVRFWTINVACRVRKTGLGGALVDAVLKEIPKGSYIRVKHDYSNGFWKHIEQKYNDYTWNLW